MSDEQEAGYDLIMPFVTVASKGGPHDDDSYTAGFEMGRLDAVLALGIGIAVRYRMTIQTVSRAQADLIAMRHGCTARFADTEVDGWTVATFHPAGEEPTDV